MDRLAGVLDGVQAICEPVVRDTSVILSGEPMSCPVRVINDRARGLVALFELYRVDKNMLSTLVDTCIRGSTVDDATLARFLHEHVNLVETLGGASCFLSSPGDVRAALHHLVTAAAAMTAAGTRDGTVPVSMATVRDLHDCLTSVMVENLPVEVFLARFDRPYTAFHVDSRDAGDWLFPSFFEHMQGTLLVSIDSRDLPALDPLHLDRVVDLPPGSDARSRRLMVMTRAP